LRLATLVAVVDDEQPHVAATTALLVRVVEDSSIVAAVCLVQWGSGGERLMAARV
jgi:hypothetical protein